MASATKHQQLHRPITRWWQAISSSSNLQIVLQLNPPIFNSCVPPRHSWIISQAACRGWTYIHQVWSKKLSFVDWSSEVDEIIMSNEMSRTHHHHHKLCVRDPKQHTHLACMSGIRASMGWTSSNIPPSKMVLRLSLLYTHSLHVSLHTTPRFPFSTSAHLSLCHIHPCVLPTSHNHSLPCSLDLVLDTFNAQTTQELIAMLSFP